VRAAQAAILVVGMVSVVPELAAQNPPAEFVQVLPQDVQWKPHPIVAGAQIAVLLGNPSGEGPYAVRMRFPPNSRVQPHTHPEARSYTVLSGEWKLGFGERFDEAQLRSYPAGSLYRLPPNVAHYQASGAVETIIQIQGRGPSATNFIKPGGGDR
ncbi:MAG TPA: cupin domain-containing protein, partial [bacterium]|nr:cupin domain-containing protein [bacterium]